MDRNLEKAASQEYSPIRPRWTLKYLVQWCWDQFQVRCCRETIRQALKRLGYSWKKAKKLLNKADTGKRADFLETLKPLLSKAMFQKRLLVYIDEAHIHQETDIGYGWSRKGERFWVSSHSPKLADKITFYGIYYYNLGQVRIWPYPCGRKEHTVNVLERIRQEHPDREIDIVWDGASWHTTHVVRGAGLRLNLNIIQMPAYSPDFMPVEALWRWLREDITYHHCHKTAEDLLKAVNSFTHRINQNPEEIADRLWVKDSLNDEEESMRSVRLSAIP
ncbi:IS630 family transposase [Endozoicomonas sp. Mp262]|uniref:IS630 family transposase n=1 Tax=Endozoicomonas sp. Mp262 TaxID=2919499 RepID=UPI0021E01FBE